MPAWSSAVLSPLYLHYFSALYGASFNSIISTLCNSSEQAILSIYILFNGNLRIYPLSLFQDRVFNPELCNLR